MKLFLRQHDMIWGMSDLDPKRTNVPVIIWIDHNGVDARKVAHRKSPRVKIVKDKHSISISIEEHPRILAKSRNIPKNVMNDLQKGVDYIARNWDVFLKHYLDTDFTFGDDELKDELRRRGEYN